MPSTNQLPRPLGKAERLFWLYDKVCCSNFVTVATASTEVTHAAVEGALRELASAHPLLGMRIKALARRRVAYEPCKDSVVLTRAEGDDDALDELIVRELDSRFREDEEPLYRAVLFTHSGSRRRSLVCTFHHGLTDAMPGALFVREVMERASAGRAPVEELTAPPAIEQLAPPPLSGLAGVRRYARWLASDLRWRFQNGRTRVPPCAEGIHVEDRTLLLVSHRIESEALEALVRRCRQEGTTVHAAICAAQLLALREEFAGPGEIPLSINSPINMRSALGATISPRSFGMYTGLAATLHSVNEGSSLWDTAREVKQRLEAKRDRGDPFLLWRFLPPMVLSRPNHEGGLAVERFLKAGPAMTLVTNLGRLEAQVACQKEPNPLWVRFAMAPPRHSPLCTAVCTLHGALRIECVFNTALIEPKRAREISRRLLDRLRTAAAGFNVEH